MEHQQCQEEESTENLFIKNRCFHIEYEEYEAYRHVQEINLYKSIKKYHKEQPMGEENPEAHLGWTTGADSARWPSMKLTDYKDTYDLLCILT
ncbi:hypothetical protein TcasGA2_TC032976 [Tribolium castaneum]|uniref:Uncharacterized protein n=1 Tax=Tribolium castaneum TaxID=7070 RepID=A0A139W8D4_TRICA|nr:hypothetical protein TcasGA2_TC032976 [Tribolium castaneum]